jgi:hypothetical protein
MPKVGGKEFSYDAEGVRKAQEYSAKTGIPMEIPKRYNVGGLTDGQAKVRVGKNLTTRGIGKAIRGTRTRGMI